RSLIGVAAPDYAMAHIHLSSEKDGVATMTGMDQLDIKPDQTITLEPGGLHVMLMRPSEPLTLGGTVTFDMQFANGETVAVSAEVVERYGGS
ncbi:MAG: copper chaperone PCu(A)C, partial [Paracoccaceae bacterium]